MRFHLQKYGIVVYYKKYEFVKQGKYHAFKNQKTY